MKIKPFITIILITVFLIGLFVLADQVKDKSITYFEDTNVACLAQGHQNLDFHVHPKMKITVDGVDEIIPANIGINAGCMSEIHTHDATGEIHVESFNGERLKEMSIADLYKVWGVSPEREGYNLEIYLDGELKNSVANIPIIDHSQIEMKYTSK